jgi:hypothetical protein
MTWFDFFLHLVNLIVPAFGVAALGAAITKLLWRRRLTQRRWHVLAGWSFAAGVVVTLASLAIFGNDGRMATYIALCAACAVALWWSGFVRR